MEPIDACYESGVLTPERPLALPQGELVRLIVQRRPDPQTGEQKAVFDLAWPHGLQEELASLAGFRCFTNIEDFKRYVALEILAVGVPA